MDKVFYGLSISDVQRIVFQYVEKNKVVHNFDTSKGIARVDFIHGFLKRNPEISLRKPQGVALNRVFLII